jgi:hypothetical protein
VRAGPAGGGVGRRVQPRQHGHPHLDVAALQPAHLRGLGVRQRAEVAVLDGDQRGVVEGEVDLELDQRAQLGGGVGAGLGHPLAPAGEQALADPHEHLGEHRVLAREVPVDRRAGDTDRRADVVHADRPGAPLGEQLRGRLEDLLPARGAIGIGVQCRVAHGGHPRMLAPM